MAAAILKPPAVIKIPRAIAPAMNRASVPVDRAVSWFR